MPRSTLTFLFLLYFLGSLALAQRPGSHIRLNLGVGVNVIPNEAWQGGYPLPVVELAWYHPIANSSWGWELGLGYRPQSLTRKLQEVYPPEDYIPDGAIRSQESEVLIHPLDLLVRFCQRINTRWEWGFGVGASAILSGSSKELAQYEDLDGQTVLDQSQSRVGLGLLRFARKDQPVFYFPNLNEHFETVSAPLRNWALLSSGRIYWKWAQEKWAIGIQTDLRLQHLNNRAGTLTMINGQVLLRYQI